MLFYYYKIAVEAQEMVLEVGREFNGVGEPLMGYGLSVIVE